MNDTDRQFLTEWGGECWHEISDDAEPSYVCPKCGIILTAIHYSDWNPKAFYRTFDTWADFGWLWEKLEAYLIEFIFWHAKQKPMTALFNGQSCSSALVEFERLSPAERSQLICDFLRERADNPCTPEQQDGTDRREADHE